MGRIITVTDDLAAFEGIIDLIGTSATPEEVDANPLFQGAESEIIGLIPNAELPGGRTDPKRAQIVSALQFCTAWFMLSGGGATATKGAVIAGGAISGRSETIDEITTRIDYATGGTTTVQTTNISDRLDFFRKQCDTLVAEINGTTAPSLQGRFYVGQTRSRRKQY